MVTLSSISTLPCLQDMDKIKQNLATIIKVKDIILKEMEEKKPRSVPVAGREKKTDDQRVVIKL